MDKSTIQTLIDKVIGKKGLIRVPSWWMRKVLMQIADWVQEGDDANGKKIEKVKEEADGKISTLDNNIKAALVELKKSLHTQKCFIVKTGAGAGYVIVDGVKQDIPANTQKIVTYVDTFGFYKQGSNNSYLIFIGLTVADTSSITDMSNIFSACHNLTSLDLTGLDTSAVTNMSYMFDYCERLTSLDLTGLNTSAVTNMSSMFYSCSNLTSLDLSSLNTSAVTDMSSMFDRCYALTSLDLSSFNTSAVTNMYSMFSSCTKLTSLDLSSFDTSAVTDMSSMFYGYRSEGVEYNCGVKSLDLSSFDTSAVTNMSNMFCYCINLVSLDLSSFDTSAVTDTYNMSEMFYECRSLTSLILGPNFFKTPNVKSIDFSYSTKWTNDTVVTSLVTNSYDRATAGLSTMTLQLSANTKAALTDEQKAAITAKGYTIA